MTIGARRRVLWPRAGLAAATIVAAHASACNYTQVHLDGGYQTPVTERHDGGVTGTAGLGACLLRNRIVRVAVVADYAARPVANAGLLSLEGNLFVHRWPTRRKELHGRSINLFTQAGLVVVARASAGPAFGDATWVGESSLGFGTYRDDMSYDSDESNVFGFFTTGTIDVVATRTEFPDHVDWMLGGRLSFTIPSAFPFFIRNTNPSKVYSDQRASEDRPLPSNFEHVETDCGAGYYP